MEECHQCHQWGFIWVITHSCWNVKYIIVGSHCGPSNSTNSANNANNVSTDVKMSRYWLKQAKHQSDSLLHGPGLDRCLLS